MKSSLHKDVNTKIYHYVIPDTGHSFNLNSNVLVKKCLSKFHYYKMVATHQVIVLIDTLVEWVGEQVVVGLLVKELENI